MKDMIQPPMTQPNSEFGGPASGSPSPKPAASGIDLVKIKQYAHIIIRRIWIVATCFTIAMVFSVLSVSKQISTYKATAILLLSRGTPLPGQLQGQEFDIFGDFILTQVRIVYSRAIAQRAREILNMSEAEVGRLYQNLAVGQIGNSSTLQITVKALDPQFAADYANAVANAYVEFKADERVTGAQTAAVNLTQQANRIREELKKAEEALMVFKKENFYVTAFTADNIAADVMADAGKRAAAYRLERMILEMQRPLLTDASDDVVLAALNSRYVPMAPVRMADDGRADTARAVGGQETAAVMSSPLGMIDLGDTDANQWVSLKREKTKLESDLRLARENLRDSHPTIKKLQNQLKLIEASIDREVQFAAENYYAELEALTIKESSLTRVQSMWLEEAMKSETLIDQYQAYYNDIERLKKLLDAVFSRIREIDITSGIIPDNVSILEEAVPRNSPENPRKVQSIFLAGLIGIGVGIGIIFGLEFLDDSIRYPEDIEKSLDVRFLGVIPSANWSETDIRTHLLSQIDPKSGLAESYRNIRATILMGDKSRQFKTLLMTSSVPKEGKTTTSLNLALSFAQAGLRVLLVDADMRRGELHKFFGLEGGRGLSDVLSGQTKMESVIQRTGNPNLDLVATGPFPVNPAELILRNEFRFFLDHASRSYDKIIFDGPPVMAVSEVAVLSSLVDTTVLVVWAGKTSRKLCQLTIQNLVQRGAHIEGCILNNLEFGRVGYYYYSTYYSYYTYDYRYDETTRGA